MSSPLPLFYKPEGLLHLFDNQWAESPMPNYNFASLEELLLEDCNLVGPISPGLATFGPLSFVSLGFNALTGAIPAGLSDVDTLKILYLNNNELNGNIPDLGGLGSLEELYLNNNELTGNIPAVGDLLNLSTYRDGSLAKCVGTEIFSHLHLFSFPQPRLTFLLTP